MNTQMEWFLTPVQNAWLTASFLNIAMKSFILLSLAMGICVLWRGASAASRHLIWFLAVISLACLPFITSSLPTGENSLWSVSAGSVSSDQISLGLEFVPGKKLESAFAQSEISPNAANKISAVKRKPENDKTFTAHLGMNWLELCFLAWGGGVFIVLIPLIFGQFQLRQYRRHAKKLKDAEWITLSTEVREMVGLNRTVTLLQSPHNVMPMTWGWRWPTVLLPMEASNWTVERRRMVLLHELAHVKRGDCLTQFVAEIIRAFYWFNPLVWWAAWQMRVERERACDDLLLNAGCKASDYAGHLVEIAESYRHVPQIGAVAMARSSGLWQRVEAILDAHRNRNRIARWTAVSLVAVFLSLGWLVGSQAAENLSSTWTLENSTVAKQLKHFIAEKAAQEASLVKTDEADFMGSYDSKHHNLILPDCKPFFEAASNTDWPAVSNMWSDLEKGTLGTSKSTNGYPPHGLWMQPVRETLGAVEAFTQGNGKYSEMFGRDVIQSIPPGSIYFGGADAGRFIVTMMQKSQVKGEPIFAITQNALADLSYLHYLRLMYGNEIYIPTGSDARKCFEAYTKDARKRAESHQLKPGEHVKIEQGRMSISGRTAVMEINALLAKVIFDHTTNRDYYIEESWPLDWMYPHLEPHGLIFKINRQPLPELSETMVKADRAYWQKLVPEMIGNWLNNETSVKQIADFARKVFLHHDLDGFAGDPGFVQNAYTSKMFSKLRCSIAGLYAWRCEHATADAEKERMSNAADFAFRQALALCPSSSETTERYATFLKNQHREDDAQLVQDLTEQFKAQPAGSPTKKVKTQMFQMRLVVDHLDKNAEKMSGMEMRDSNGKPHYQVLFVQKKVLLDQTELQSATASKDALGQPIIEVTFNSTGRKKFTRITQEHLHQQLAIVIDGKLVEAPSIQSEITGGTCQISGIFTEKQAKDMAAKITATIGN